MRFEELRARVRSVRERVSARAPLALVLASAALSAALVAASLAGAGGVRQLKSLQRDAAKAEAVNRTLEAQIQELERTARALGNPPDPRALEKAAREQLGYIKQDELLFKFE